MALVYLSWSGTSDEKREEGDPSPQEKEILFSVASARRTALNLWWIGGDFWFFGICGHEPYLQVRIVLGRDSRSPAGIGRRRIGLCPLSTTTRYVLGPFVESLLT